MLINTLFQTEFKPEEVKIPEVPGLFTTFFAKGKALFLDPRLFDQPEHYAKIMGFDKPIDFKLNEKPPPQTDKHTSQQNFYCMAIKVDVYVQIILRIVNCIDLI